jgi:hypothetical protein
MWILRVRVFLKQRALRPSVDWLWPLALLALPGCAEILGIEPWTPETSLTTLVFCDFPKPPPDGPTCIKPDEIDIGIRQAAAAVALNTGQTKSITIDESDTALAACAATTGGPQAVVFQGPFPQGIPGCADPGTLTNANKFCVTVCSGEGADGSFCASNAHASTNVPLTGFPGLCSAEGAPGSEDPRIKPEKVVWDPDPANLIGVTPNGNDLQRSAPTSPPANNPPFDAGAASTQRIEHGDAYVEFSAAENTLSHVIGLSEIPDGCASPCTDTDPSLADITFAISLNLDGRFYVLEGGVQVTGPDINGSFGTYDPNDPAGPNPRFRVSLRQSADGTKTATVTYSRLTASCNPGNPCPEDVFYTHVGLAHYPLRVDTSFREANATLTNVTVVRIQ